MHNGLVGFMGFVAFVILPSVGATHVNPCFPTFADPASIIQYEVVGRTFYEEERNNPLGFPAPLSGILFRPDPPGGDGIPDLRGQGTWIYEETNGFFGLQRGGQVGGCTDPDTCLTITDPQKDEDCHAGPDTLYFGRRI